MITFDTYNAVFFIEQGIDITATVTNIDVIDLWIGISEIYMCN